jgi:hypothetical protein
MPKRTFLLNRPHSYPIDVWGYSEVGEIDGWATAPLGLRSARWSGAYGAISSGVPAGGSSAPAVCQWSTRWSAHSPG